MSIHNPKWRYAPVSETAKPGYLARKFAKIRAEQAAAEKEVVPVNVRPLKKRDLGGSK